METLAEKIALERQRIHRQRHEIEQELKRLQYKPSEADQIRADGLLKKYRQLGHMLPKLVPGSVQVCPGCGRVKSAGSRVCRDCMHVENEARDDAFALAAFNSPESQSLLNQKKCKRLDRFTRVFSRWFRWRRKYVQTFLNPVAEGVTVCECGAPKLLSKKVCDTCRDTRKILRSRIACQSPDLRDEATIVKKREPRFLRLLTPWEYESDQGCGWDDIIKIIEDSRR